MAPESSRTPFDMVTRTVDERTAQAFESLGNTTRLAILLALWDAKDPDQAFAAESDSDLTFTELRKRVGMQDSGQFNYHLGKLTDLFVDQPGDGYTLTSAGNQVLSTVIAGAFANHRSFTDEPAETTCWFCDSPVVIDYRDRTLTLRCTNCEGGFRYPDESPGILLRGYRPPAGLMNRTPQEFHRNGNVMSRHESLSFFEGVCPNCTGTVTATARICESHEPEVDSLCQHCRRRDEIYWRFVCDICKSSFGTPGWSPVFTDMGVLSFCYERGVNIYEVHDTDSWSVIYERVEMTVHSREPLQIEIRIEFEGDQLDIVLDDEARVIDVTETTTESG